MDASKIAGKALLLLRGGEPAWTPRALIFVALVTGAMGLLVAAHVAAGLTLPAPWGDEAYFVWQARAFERWNSFVAPELDPARPLLLLPYGYPLILGVVFKIFGYSLATARAVSLVATLAGLVLLASAMRKRETMMLSLVLILIFMMNGHFVAMANNSRMEAIIFAIICGALVLVQNRAAWPALGLLTMSAMIHPNAILMAVPVGIYALFTQRLFREWPTRWGWIMIGAAIAAWLAQGFYVLAHFAAFKHDLAYRLSETTSANQGASQFGGWYAVGLAMIFATGALAAWRKVPVVHLLVFAVGAWLLSRVRIEQWYEVFNDFACLLTVLALVEILAVEARKQFPQFRLAPAAAACGFAAVSLVFFLKTGRIDGPKGYFTDLTVDGMVMADEVPYFTGTDKAAIEAYFDGLNTGAPVTVEYYPWGDTLLFGDIKPSETLFQIPYFDPAYVASTHNWPWGYGPTYGETPDVYILRSSKYQPSWLDARFETLMARARERTGGEPVVLLSRDGTETWYAVAAPVTGPQAE